MFDPIVFDNLKVVVEGEIYDLDLEGIISVVNREDLVDLAQFSRLYCISFQTRSTVTATMKLTTDLDNIYAELSTRKQRKERPACRVEVHFTLQDAKAFSDQMCEEIQNTMVDLWGGDYPIEQKISYIYGSNHYENKVTVAFNRFIYEDQVDDLIQMIDYMLKTLEKLGAIYP